MNQNFTVLSVCLSTLRIMIEAKRYLVSLVKVWADLVEKTRSHGENVDNGMSCLCRHHFWLDSDEGFDPNLSAQHTTLWKKILTC